ncbi:MAG: hypothetical protein AVDCRST_MAG77-5525, partial [uncultured Chloroflexi bacterium]
GSYVPRPQRWKDRWQDREERRLHPGDRARLRRICRAVSGGCAVWGALHGSAACARRRLGCGGPAQGAPGGGRIGGSAHLHQLGRSPGRCALAQRTTV